MAALQLSKESPYEKVFGVRHRGSGRPTGSGEDGAVFPRAVHNGVDPLIVAVAKRRAYAVIHQEQRERLSEIFAAEVGVLKRRGVVRVARDVGVVDTALDAASEA